MRWRDRLIRALGGVVPEREGSFVVQAEVERGEEVRVYRQAPNLNDLLGDGFIPSNIPDRPLRTLGPIE